MKTNKNILIIILSLLLINISCRKEQILERDYPRVDLLEISQNESGINFKGEILTEGISEIKEKGFVWSSKQSPTVDQSSKLSVPEPHKTGVFEGNAVVDFVKGKEYEVRAYLKTNEYLVYSKAFGFKSEFSSPSPEITDFNPKYARWNDTLTIYGKYFSFIKEQINVYFGTINSEVVECQDNKIRAIVPDIENPDSVKLSIEVYENDCTSQTYFKYVNPILDDFYPKTGTFLDTILITGIDFPENQNECIVKMGGINAQIISNTSSNIQFTIPAELTDPESEISVYFYGMGIAFDSLFKLDAPIISSFSPEEVFHVSTPIIITGMNFSPIVENNRVFIGDIETDVESSSSKSILFHIPDDIIYDPEISVIDSFVVSVTTAEQTTYSSERLKFSYLSKWTKKIDFPGQPRITAVSFSYQGKGYYGLGSYDYDTHYNDFWEYNPINDNWIELAPLPSAARGRTAQFIIGGKIYVCCGTTGNPEYSETNTDQIWEYDISSDTWTQKSSFPGGVRYGAFGFSIGDKGYLGAGSFGSAVVNIYSDFWEYDPITDTWTEKNDVTDLTAYNEISIEAFNTDSYGYAFARKFYSAREFWKYFPITDEWIEIPTHSYGRSGVIGFNIDQYLYIGTGGNYDWIGSTAFYKFDTNNNSWTTLSFKGDPRRDANSFTIENYGYIFGGKHDSNYANIVDVWMFDPTK